MNQDQFETKWYRMLVKSKGYYNIPDRNYVVTAAIYSEEESIFAVMSDQWSTSNPEWYTIRLTKEEVDKLDDRFEIIGRPLETQKIEKYD